MQIGRFGSRDNPKGWNWGMDTARNVPQVNGALCTLCGACVEACPCHAIELTDEGPILHCPEVCAHGGTPCSSACEGFCTCEDVCPTGAIECPFEIVVVDGLSGGATA